MPKWIFAILLSFTGIFSALSYLSNKFYTSSEKNTVNPAIKVLEEIPNIDLLQSDIDSLFEKAYSENAFPSSAVAIVKNDSLIYMNTFGNKDATSSEKVDTRSIFRLGSLSKGFHGLLTQILVNKECITWEDKIADFVPEFKLHNRQYQAEITVSNLVSHTGGFPYHSYTNLVEAGTPLKKIAREFESIKKLQQPGTQYSYQNAAFAVSQLVLEKCSNLKYDLLLRENLLVPTGMKNASCDYEALDTSKNVALPQRFIGGQWTNRQINKKYFNAIAAGGINASIGDMSEYLKLLLGNKPEIISKEDIRNVFCPKIETKTKYKYYQKWPNFENSFYGHGWRIHTFYNPQTAIADTMIHHGGQVNGYRNEIMVMPSDQLAICVLFSNYTLKAKTIIPEMVAIIKNQGIID